MKNYGFYLVLFLMVNLFPENPGDWSQLGHDNHHTFSSELDIPENLEITWAQQVNLSFGSAPAVVGKRIYGFSDQTLLCLDLESGNVVFEIPAHVRCPSTPTVIGGRVYCAGGENLILCLDADSRDLIWDCTVPDIHWINPLVHDNLVYVTAQNMYPDSGDLPILDCGMIPRWLTVVALDRETGRKVWQYTCSGSPHYEHYHVGFPVLVDDSLYFSETYFETEEDYYGNDEQSNLICLDAQTGALLFKHEFSLPKLPSELGSTTPSWIAVFDDRMFTSIRGTIVCTDIQSQLLMWQFSFSEGWNALLSVNREIVAGHTASTVYGVDTESGENIWKIQISGETFPAVTREDVFSGSSDGHLYRINTKTGKISEKYFLGGFVFSPVVTQEHVLVGTSEGTLYCLGPSDYSWWIIIGLGVGIIFTIMVIVLFMKSDILKEERRE